MAKVELKQPVVEEIKELLNGAASAVLVEYRGITVEEDTNLRKEFREAGITYKVYKNTMIRFAVQGTEFEPLTADLEGPTAIAVSKDDATAPARIAAKYAKQVKPFELKSGVIEGTYYDKDGIQVIATIPSREELLSKLLGSIQSPIANFARVIKQIAEAQEGGAAEEA
ncbi:MAG: 50S ribosomal protein L10 [Lachnospiraceae bacterium]|nr:50S ribosomal protein L10 [Lachnospiraceae bacterium]